MKAPNRDSVVHETISLAIEKSRTRASASHDGQDAQGAGYDRGTRAIVISVVLCATCWAALGYFLLT